MVLFKMQDTIVYQGVVPAVVSLGLRRFPLKIGEQQPLITLLLIVWSYTIAKAKGPFDS